MHPLVKTSVFFCLSIALGNMLLWIGKIFLGASFDLNWELKNIILILIVTTIFSLPLFLPCVIFFFIQKNHWYNFNTRITSTLVFSVILCVGWGFMIDTIAGQENFFYTLIPFMIAPPLSGILMELWLEHKQCKSPVNLK